MAAQHVPSAFPEVLRAALALAPSDQASLREVLLRMAESDLDAVPDPEASEEDPVADTALATQPPAPPAAAVQPWLRRIAAEPAWLQLQLLDEALASCATPAEFADLAAARIALLRAHPPLALRLRVTELATLHPLRVGVAAVGLLLGLAGLGRGLLRLLF